MTREELLAGESKNAEFKVSRPESRNLIISSRMASRMASICECQELPEKLTG